MGGHSGSKVPLSNMNSVPYVGGHHTGKETALSLGRHVFATLAIVVATAPQFGSFITPAVSRTRLDFEPLCSHWGREANGPLDVCCSTLQGFRPEPAFGLLILHDKTFVVTRPRGETGEPRAFSPSRTM